jgi:hypothetical protein
MHRVSFTGLISYPLLFEPALDLDAQRRLWSFGFVLVALLVAACAALAWTRDDDARPCDRWPAQVHPRSERATWLVLALLPASLMIGVTTYISTDIAAIPLVWIVPLLLYLLSLAIAFARPRVSRVTQRLVPIVVLAPMLWFLTGSTRPAWLQIPTHLMAVFVLSLACHQALAATRPEPARLPQFYLWLASGGAAGGLVAALVAPLVFPTPVEYPIALLLACYAGMRAAREPRMGWSDATVAVLAAASVLLMSLIARRTGWAPNTVATSAIVFGPAVLLATLVWIWPRRFVLALGAALAASLFAVRASGRTLLIERNFFGVHRVVVDDTGQFRQLMNGTTIHGLQAIDREKDDDGCFSYYSRIGPAGQVFAALNLTRPPQDVAVLGLGAGSLSCYASAGQRWTFFEIDPIVARLAERPEYFSYLQESRAATTIVLGDARLSLARRAGHQYALIVLDTFSSDAIPVHLLTREALHIYLKNLAPRGLILFHISNLYFNLEPVVGRLAAEAGLTGLSQHHSVEDWSLHRGVFPSSWVAVARNIEDLGALPHDRRWHALLAAGPLWTDRASNVLAALDIAPK